MSTTSPITMAKQKISNNLWFDTQGEEAAKFYTSIFENSKIGMISRYGKEGREIHGKPEGAAMVVQFWLDGQQFTALNGGPQFKINPSISFFIYCKTKDEVEHLWEKLSEGGTALMALDKYPFSELYGWVQDQFGLSWQLMLSPDDNEQKIIPSMLFVGKQAGRAEEAIDFYTQVFDESKKGNMARYEKGQEPNKVGTIMYADFTLLGQRFVAMDSAQNHDFKFNEAVSYIVNCDTQKEVDYYWEKLSDDVSAEQCGWLKDKFGVSWQIVPKVLPKLLSNPDPKKSQAVMKAMLQMKKLDIDALEKAG